MRFLCFRIHKNHELFQGLEEPEIEKILICTGAAVCKYERAVHLPVREPFPK